MGKRSILLLAVPVVGLLLIGGAFVYQVAPPPLLDRLTAGKPSPWGSEPFYLGLAILYLTSFGLFLALLLRERMAEPAVVEGVAIPSQARAAAQAPPAVRFDKVSKRFIVRHERPRSFQELAVGLFRNNGSREELWALRDVSFTVRQGETLGLIGPNGAGKSTVLKLVSRILEPTDGRITVNGRVSALLELGAGFHPDLTGRENVYLNGSILGLSRREMREKFDSIVRFAELERFIDMPVKHYSSGMYMRLGFAIAIHVDPDVLLIDEVLAVGDQSFQQKCLERINEMRGRGVTILFVSHNLEAVRNLCDKALWLDNGVIRAQGATGMVIDRYMASVLRAEEERLEVESLVSSEGDRWGSREVEIVEVRFLDQYGLERRVFATGEPMTVRIRYRARDRIQRPVFGVAIYRNDGMHINGPNTRLAGYEIDHLDGEGEIDYTIHALNLLEGTYELSAAIYDYECVHPYDHQHRRYTFVVRRGVVSERYGMVYLPSRWEHRPHGRRSGP
ncbi:MAG: ABC transporter ATP-binding protein [Anaerolineae bacterium]